MFSDVLVQVLDCFTFIFEQLLKARHASKSERISNVEYAYHAENC